MPEIKKEIKDLRKHFADMPSKDIKDFLKLLKENDVERDTIDLFAMDKKISSLEGLKETVKEEYGLDLVNIKEEIQQHKAEEEKMHMEMEQKATEEELLVVENFKNAKPQRQLKIKSFEIPKHLIKMVAQRHSYATILVGPGGLGKSWLAMSEVRRTLKKEEWEFLNGYVTPLALFKFLHNNKDKIIIFDDIRGLLEHEKSVSILKGALWPQESGDRIVCYESTSKLLKEEGIPTKFIFEGRLIILANKINEKDTNIQALKSRCHFHHMELSIPEILTIMKQIINMPYEDFTKKERETALNLIEERAENNPAIMEFNLRMLIKAYEYVRYSKKEEKDTDKMLVEAMMTRDEELAYIYQMIEEQKYSVEDQIAKFTLKFDRSRRTYYHRKRKLLKLMGKKAEEF